MAIAIRKCCGLYQKTMNRDIKVLSLVSYHFLPPKMGGQKGIALFNAYLSRTTDLTCITIKNNDTSFAPGYPVKNILSNSKFRYINPAYFFLLKKIIKKEGITHLILEHPYYGWLGILLKKFCKVKLVVHSHNLEAGRFKSMGKWWWGILWHYEKMTHRKADLNFFIQDDDRDLAMVSFKLDPPKCHTITYGFEMEKAPAPEEKFMARNLLRKTYSIHPDEKILLFNGTLDYLPNKEALDIILEKINPLLLADVTFKYRIIICGNKLPAAYDKLGAYANKHIIYAGFVDDISLYFKGADIFINPVIEGGGIKTKVVEALGYDLSVVSTQSGAIGIPVAITGDKLNITADGNWEEFARQVVSIDPGNKIPSVFFDHFYWGNIAGKAAALIAK